MTFRGTARFAWNWALAEWQKQYESGERPTGLQLKKQFNALKKAHYPWVYDVTKYACQQPFLFLQQAFNRFFKGVARYPKFKKKGVKDSFYLGNDHISVEGTRLRIPKLGWVRMREFLRFAGKIVSATISRIANKWFVSLQVELPDPTTTCENQAVVGVDLGITTLATLFDGNKIDKVRGPKPLRKSLKKLKRLQRRFSRKIKGSNNRAKQRDKLALLHFRIRNIRQDALHKLTSRLIREYGSIAIEDLKVSGMLANHKLARSLSDMGLYEFRRQLIYKAEANKNQIHVADRWFPSSKQCSQCQHKNEDLTLRDRIFHCQVCGFQEDRDVNAAMNLFSTVSSTGIHACGEESTGL